MTGPDWRAIERAALELAERGVFNGSMELPAKAMMIVLSCSGLTHKHGDNWRLKPAGRERLAALREEDGSGIH